jgi:mRNA degradation ribonuclease J1/J2
VEVKPDVRPYIRSAHADKRGLLDIISMVAPKATMLVHGERRRQAEFRAVLRSRGDNVVPTARVEL